jgi:hypothetical protein
MYKEYRGKGLEVVALMLEHCGDFERAAAATTRFRRRLGRTPLRRPIRFDNVEDGIFADTTAALYRLMDDLRVLSEQDESKYT